MHVDMCGQGRLQRRTVYFTVDYKSIKEVTKLDRFISKPLFLLHNLFTPKGDKFRAKACFLMRVISSNNVMEIIKCPKSFASYLYGTPCICLPPEL